MTIAATAAITAKIQPDRIRREGAAAATASVPPDGVRPARWASVSRRRRFRSARISAAVW